MLHTYLLNWRFVLKPGSYFAERQQSSCTRCWMKAPHGQLGGHGLLGHLLTGTHPATTRCYFALAACELGPCKTPGALRFMEGRVVAATASAGTALVKTPESDVPACAVLRPAGKGSGQDAGAEGRPPMNRRLPPCPGPAAQSCASPRLPTGKNTRPRGARPLRRGKEGLALPRARRGR